VGVHDFRVYDFTFDVRVIVERRDVYAYVAAQFFAHDELMFQHFLQSRVASSSGSRIEKCENDVAVVRPGFIADGIEVVSSCSICDSMSPLAISIHFVSVSFLRCRYRRSTGCFLPGFQEIPRVIDFFHDKAFLQG